MKRLLLCSALIILLAATTASADDPLEKLTYLTEEFRPYNYREHGEAKGIAVDLLRQVWRRLGVAAQPIRFQPWARAYDTTLNEPGTVLFSTVKTPEREKLFQWAGPIAYSRTVLIARRDKEFPFSSESDIRNVTVGVVRDYPSEFIVSKLSSTVRIDVVSNVNLCIDKLAQGRVDLISMEETAFRKTIERTPYSVDDFKTVWLLAETISHFAFNKGIDPELVARFQKALDEVRHSATTSQAGAN